MPTSPESFSLVTEEWLPVRDRTGAASELGILPTLARAHELSGLSGDLPTQTFALTRLLLAVLHSVLRGPEDLDEWEGLWEAETLPLDRIEQYMAQYRERFDLLHSDAPFLQVPGLRTGKGDTSDLSKLVADVPNGVPVFATRRGALALAYAEAARWLVHVHAYDLSGIKSGALGDENRVRNGKGYPIGVAWSGWLGGVLVEGETFKDTLLLNLLPNRFEGFRRDPHLDLPVWERPPLTAQDESGQADQGREPTGPVDLYAWPSRRVRLVAEGGQVTRVLIANGNRLSPQNRHDVEPHSAWRNSEAQQKIRKTTDPVYMPRAHDPDRAIWRGLESLLPGVASRQGATGSARLAPIVMEWLGHLCSWDVVPSAHEVRIRAVGMVYGAQASVVDDIVHDTLSLRAGLARHDAAEQAEFVQARVRDADDAVFHLGNLAGDLVVAAGGIGDGLRSRARERLYARLDPEFREWLLRVDEDTDTAELLLDWHRRARRITQDAADELLANVSPACWVGREVRGRPMTAAHAENRFRLNLRKALPAAYVTTHQ